MKYQELRDKSVEELHKMHGEQRVVRGIFRSHVAIGQQKNVRVGRVARKLIARILTVLRSRNTSGQ